MTRGPRVWIRFVSFHSPNIPPHETTGLLIMSTKRSSRKGSKMGYLTLSAGQIPTFFLVQARMPSRNWSCGALFPSVLSVIWSASKLFLGFLFVYSSLGSSWISAVLQEKEREKELILFSGELVVKMPIWGVGLTPWLKTKVVDPLMQIIRRYSFELSSFWVLCIARFELIVPVAVWSS